MVLETESLSPEDTVWQLVTASQTTHAARAMAVHGLADHLAASPRTVAELAEATGTHAPTLARLLNVLVALGLCVYTEAGRVEAVRLQGTQSGSRLSGH